MSDPMKQVWSDVEEGFSTLGRMMKERYRGADEHETSNGTVAGSPPDDDTVAGGPHDPAAALGRAFDRLVAAGREFGDRAADVARDDDVKAQAKRAAGSLNEALSAVVDLIGEQVGGLFKRSDKGVSTPEAVTPEDPPYDSGV